MQLTNLYVALLVALLAVNVSLQQDDDDRRGRDGGHLDRERPDREDGERPDRGDGERPDREDGERPDREDSERPDRGDGERSERGERRSEREDGRREQGRDRSSRDADQSRRYGSWSDEDGGRRCQEHSNRDCRQDCDHRPTQREGCRRPSRDSHFRGNDRDVDRYFPGFRSYGRGFGGYGHDFDDYARYDHGRDFRGYGPYPGGYGMEFGRYGHDCGDCDRSYDRDFDGCGCEHANNREQRRDSTRRCRDRDEDHKREADKRAPERRHHIPCKVVANDTGATIQRQCRHNETCTVGPVRGPRGSEWLLYFCARPCRNRSRDMDEDNSMDQDEDRDMRGPDRRGSGEDDRGQRGGNDRVGKRTDMMGENKDAEDLLKKVEQAYRRHCAGARRDGSGEDEEDGDDE